MTKIMLTYWSKPGERHTNFKYLEPANQKYDIYSQFAQTSNNHILASLLYL